MVELNHPLVQKFCQWSPRSARFMERACGVFPGGDTRASAHFDPWPLVMERGQGCYLYDIDGHELLDFMNNFTSMIHGHAHPETVTAVAGQVSLGSAHAAPGVKQVALAELIVSRVPSVERMRFCSSGSEATLMAIRCARAVTGRQKIMKMEGGYHGSYELAEVSLIPSPDKRGELEHPVSLPVDGSIPDSVLGDTVVCPYNQPAIATRLIEGHADDLAAVIVEPVLGSMGMVPATTEFLQTLRRESRKHDVLLIFDEVITLRQSEGGEQKRVNVTPDLTCMGKIIGGGLPVGAVGGSADLMQIFSPENTGKVFHASTFSGNALTMAAGHAALCSFDEREAERVNHLGERLRRGFDEAFSQQGIRGQTLGSGSLAKVILSSSAMDDARGTMDAMLKAGHISSLLHLGLLRRGVFSAPRLMFCISTPMDEHHVDRAVTAMNETLAELRPVIEVERPGLLF